MSRIRADKFVNSGANGAPQLTFGAEVVAGVGLTGAGGINITGVATAASFSGNLTGNATGLTGTPNITINNLIGAAATFTGNVSIGGTLTYEDVTNIDSLGIVTARTGVRVNAGGLVVTAGISTFAGDVSCTNVRNNTAGAGNGQFEINPSDSTVFYSYRVRQTDNSLCVDTQTTNEAFVYGANGSATFTTVTDSIGQLRRLGVNAQTGAYAFVVGDAGKIIRSSGSGSALTLNQNIFTAGDMISVFNVGSGDNTVVQGTGVTLYNTADAATGTRTIAAKGMCTIVCTSSNEFAINGSQLT